MEDKKSGIFVSCKYPRKITDPTPVPPGEKSKEFFMPKGYLGEVPAWVTNHWYFKQLQKDGTVTIAVDTRSVTLEAASTAAAEAEAKAKFKQELIVKVKEAQELAKAAAEAEASMQGLDETSTKKLIEKKQNEAKKQVESALKKEYEL